MVQARAETDCGVLVGERADGLDVFRGVPFARPPVGPLRLRPPQPPEPWSGEREATTFGPAAPQPGGSLESTLFSDIAVTSEDCLYLNVWTPGGAGRRPVMVWIHGGAFVFGAGSQVFYDGSALARCGDVVVVTLNYRLGALGFLYLEDPEGAPAVANLGLLDQLAALEWVQRNIAAFGGDPSNVTLFGESAGAMSVCYLLGSPRAHGLFHKAVAQSGACQGCKSAEEGSRVAKLFLEELRRTAAGDRSLDGVPTSEIVAAQQRIMSRYQQEALLGTSLLSFSPVVDGDLLPEQPIEAIGKGSAAGIPLLIGTNRDETKLFGLGDPGASALDNEGLLLRVQAALGDPEAADRLVGAYREATRGKVAPPDLWTAIGTDYVFRIPAVRTAERQCRHAEVWFYMFAWRSPAFGGLLGASHAVEIPFVWGTLGQPKLTQLLGSGPDARRLSSAMQEAWTCFARSSRPASPYLDPWSPYDTERRSTMILDSQPRLEEDPQGSQRRAWEALPAEWSNGAP
jgi:para-nitrobenzyl esterase